MKNGWAGDGRIEDEDIPRVLVQCHFDGKEPTATLSGLMSFDTVASSVP